MDINELEKELEDLRALRDRLKSVDNAEELGEESADIREYLKDEIDAIDKELKDIEEKSKQIVEEYEKIVKEIQAEIEDSEKKLEDSMLYSDEEILELRERKERQILELNERTLENQRAYEEIKKLKSTLKRQKNTLDKRIKESEALGLSYNEYKDVYSVYRSRKIMDQILREKGLADIIDKKANERTTEEKDLLKKTKDEILKEIAEFRKDKEYEDYTVLDIVEALYSLDNSYTRVETPRETKITSKELMVINENKQILPYKVANPYVELNDLIKDIPEKEETPKDMEGAKENEKVDINELKPAEEKVTLFKDKDSNEYYVRKYAVERFKLKSADLGNEVRINGSLCYKISESDVERIKENANNAFSPYIADIKEIELEKKRDYTISPEDTKEELIPGTKIKRPRDRKPYETDDEYEAFLKSYYDKVFPQDEVDKEKEAPAIPLPPVEEEKKDELSTGDIEEIVDEAVKPKEKETEPEKENLSDEDIEEVIDGTVKQEENITVYIEGDKHYVRGYLVDKYKLSSADKSKEIMINGKPGYEISKDDYKKLITSIDIGTIRQQEIEDDDERLKNVWYYATAKNVKPSKRNKTYDDEHLKNVWHYATAKNVKASEKFKEELKENNVVYRIVHAVPKIAKKIFQKVNNLIKDTIDYYSEEHDLNDMLEDVSEATEEEAKTR